MKIYGSTEYIDDEKIGNLKLVVNSMWAFGSRNVCFREIDNIGGKMTIAYNLKECTEVIDSKSHYTRWKDAEIDQRVVDQLKSDCYTISKEYENN